MFRCLRYDNRQSTALCITQHYTVSTCFQFQLDSFSVLFDQQICTVHILSFGLVLESLGGFLWFLGQVLDFSSLRQEQPSIRRLPNSKGSCGRFRRFRILRYSHSRIYLLQAATLKRNQKMYLYLFRDCLTMV